ncbi:hypothetical protein BpHYR1_044004, partial [Brachionus plicatilis]
MSGIVLTPIKFYSWSFNQAVTKFNLLEKNILAIAYVAKFTVKAEVLFLLEKLKGPADLENKMIKLQIINRHNSFTVIKSEILYLLEVYMDSISESIRVHKSSFYAEIDKVIVENGVMRLISKYRAWWSKQNVRVRIRVRFQLESVHEQEPEKVFRKRRGPKRKVGLEEKEDAEEVEV